MKTAFLNEDLEETFFMEQPEGFIKKGEEEKVCQLKKSLYGLKQSSRQWYLKLISTCMLKIGFVKSSYDDCVYIKREEGKIRAYLLLYVDDMLIAAEDLKEISALKEQL